MAPAGGADKQTQMATDSFHTFNFDRPRGPIVLSVPHAGRRYDPDVTRQLRVPVSAIGLLEDRHADALTARATAGGVATIIADVPRLAIDLNRAADDIDPVAIRGAARSGQPVSAKARAGLGLIPTQLWDVGPLWRSPLDPDVVAQRVRAVHAPYHEAIAAMLALTRATWGCAVLIDLHSMPPIRGDDAPDIVIGDRFASSAGRQVTATAEALLIGLGLRVAVNAPYAGGYVITRHAEPAADVHAIQIEVDRRLYLDAALDRPGPGLERMQPVIALLIESLADELTGRYRAAAE